MTFQEYASLDAKIRIPITNPPPDGVTVCAYYDGGAMYMLYHRGAVYFHRQSGTFSSLNDEERKNYAVTTWSKHIDFNHNMSNNIEDDVSVRRVATPERDMRESLEHILNLIARAETGQIGDKELKDDIKKTATLALKK